MKGKTRKLGNKSKSVTFIVLLTENGRSPQVVPKQIQGLDRALEHTRGLEQAYE